MLSNKYKKTSVFVQTPDSVSNNEPFSVHGLPHQTVLTEGDENRQSCSEFVWALIVRVVWIFTISPQDYWCQTKMRKGQARGVMWHVSKLFSSLFSFIKQFLSSEITLKQVLSLKAHNMKTVDINNSKDSLHTGNTERKHCSNAQTSGENMS